MKRQIVIFRNKGQTKMQKEQLTNQYAIEFALALKIYEKKRSTKEIQTEQEMWTWYFQQRQTNQPDKNEINAATIDKQ